MLGGLEYGLQDRPHPPKPRKLDGKQEAFLVATGCSTVPEGRTRWTMQLLANQLISLGVVDSMMRIIRHQCRISFNPLFIESYCFTILLFS
ncbi:helix-turn-helix domain-containing protein [Brasilonema sp. CT11]|nr:helix-turn-helix domain-containing protein [Brasilonema sp. CT11]